MNVNGGILNTAVETDLEVSKFVTLRYVYVSILKLTSRLARRYITEGKTEPLNWIYTVYISYGVIYVLIPYTVLLNR